MQSSRAISYVTPTTLLVFVAVAYWQYTRPDSQTVEDRPATSRLAVAEQTTATSQTTTRFYLTLEPSNPAVWQDNNGEIVNFESCNSIGVNEKLAKDFPELLPGFIFIGDQHTARDEFLADESFVFVHTEHYYKTLIGACKSLNGETRIQSVVMVGHDGLTPDYVGRMSMGTVVEVCMSEIWRVDPDGGPPQLLERIRQGGHDGFYWYHEDLLTTTEQPPMPISMTMGGP